MVARRIGIGLAVTLLVVFLMIWRAPVFLPALPAAAPDIPEEPQRIFGYATLSNALVRSVVADTWLPGEVAVLEGFERVGRHLREDPDAQVQGIVFTVSPAAFRRLDRYEQTGLRYVRDRKVMVDGGEAWVYRLITWEGGR